MSEGQGLIVKIASAVDRLITSVAIAVSISALVAMFVALMLEVIVRYVTNSGLGWTTEVPNLLFPWLVMGGIVLAAQRGQHISVRVLLQFLSIGATRVLFIFLHAMLFSVFVYLYFVGLQVIEVTGSEVFPVTRMSAKWAYLSLLAGFVGIALTALTSVVYLLRAESPADVRASSAEAEE